jgi:hypothetical protein
MSNGKTTKARCKGRTADGQPCGMKPTKSGYCFNHDPARSADRAQARRKGGEARHTPHAGELGTIPEQIATIQDARQLLNYTLAELLAMDNGIARARALIALFEAFIRSFEIGEIEARLPAHQVGDILTPRIVNYRAGILADGEAPADSIPVRFVDYKQEAQHEQPSHSIGTT